jgi:hypothetical protein
MATSSAAFPLATEDPYTGGSDTGSGSDDTGSDSSSAGTIAGASGNSGSGSGGLSREGMIAIIIVVCVVAILGSKSTLLRCCTVKAKWQPVTSMILFYLAKKREWKVRERLRRSARKVVAALTPRRSEFPRSLKDPDNESNHSRSNRRPRHDNVPPTPRLRPDQLDLEQGALKTNRKHHKFGRK